MTESLIRPLDAPGVPLGTSWLPGEHLGRDLSEHGYIEEEFLLTTEARAWRHIDGQRVEVSRYPVRTRVLVRRPANRDAISGVVSLEPLHPNLERANSWRMSHDWIVRSGHVWVGVTQDPTMAGYLARYFPERYANLSIPTSDLAYDLLGHVATALHSGHFGFPASMVMISGWSATGSICRVYLQEGFLEEHRLPDGRPSVNAALIGISSGAAVRAGYPPFSGDSSPLPDLHPLRTLRGHEVPVFEVLSEFESETHWPVLRPDADAPEDRYRLYQVAGTSHANLDNNLLTNDAQWRRAGVAVSERQINEEPSDGPLSPIAVALYEALVRWAANGTAPPEGRRLKRDPQAVGPGTAALDRDRHGNALGGIRTPWVEAPLATYQPQSTPAPGFTPGEWTPHTDATRAALLVGHMVPFGGTVLAELYPGAEHYAQQFAMATERLVADRHLLREEAAALMDSVPERWARAHRPSESPATA